MEKKSNETLTNEQLLKQFTSQFELVNYAIKLAENMVKTGRDTRIKINSQNKALQIVREIEEGKDQFDEIIRENVVVETEVKTFVSQHQGEEIAPRKMNERRKLKSVIAT